MTTLGELVTNVRERLDEATSGFWTDTQLRKWVQEGARDVARRAEVLLSTAEIIGVAGQQVYETADGVPSDALRVYRAEWHNTGDTVTRYPLEYRDYNNMDGVWWLNRSQTEGIPAFFTMWGYPPQLQVTLFPTPSNSGVLTLWYYKLPTQLTNDGTDDADQVELPMGWHDVIEYYCEWVALRKDADPRWQEAQGIYEAKLDELIRVTRRWSDQIGQMVPDQSPFVPSWIWSDGY